MVIENSSGKSLIDIANEDIIFAMKEMRGYIDFTPADFMEIYRFAYNHAVDRIARSMSAEEVMTRQVATVAAETPVLETAEWMAAAKISGVPVVDADNAVIGSSKIHALGFWSVLIGAGLGAVMMLAVALLFNNISPHRRYPEFWF
ncbi:MAG: HPP family protein [Desulfobacterales bacterium]